MSRDLKFPDNPYISVHSFNRVPNDSLINEVSVDWKISILMSSACRGILDKKPPSVVISFPCRGPRLRSYTHEIWKKKHRAIIREKFKKLSVRVSNNKLIQQIR